MQKFEAEDFTILSGICCIELENKVIKFIAEEWSQQVKILNYISYD